MRTERVKQTNQVLIALQQQQRRHQTNHQVDDGPGQHRHNLQRRLARHLRRGQSPQRPKNDLIGMPAHSNGRHGMGNFVQQHADKQNSQQEQAIGKVALTRMAAAQIKRATPLDRENKRGGARSHRAIGLD